jgi:hypothetical protein
VGLGQINDVVTHMDQLTQQNASLVEEAAAAAERLDEQARRLSTLVNTFRLAEDAAGRAGLRGAAAGAPPVLRLVA